MYGSRSSQSEPLLVALLMVLTEMEPLRIKATQTLPGPLSQLAYGVVRGMRSKIQVDFLIDHTPHPQHFCGARV